MSLARSHNLPSWASFSAPWCSPSWTSRWCHLPRRGGTRSSRCSRPWSRTASWSCPQPPHTSTHPSLSQLPPPSDRGTRTWRRSRLLGPRGPGSPRLCGSHHHQQRPRNSPGPIQTGRVRPGLQRAAPSHRSQVKGLGNLKCSLQI